MAEEKKVENPAELKTKETVKNKMPVIAVVVVVALVALGGIFVSFEKGGSETEEATLSQIAPAAADDQEKPAAAASTVAVADQKKPTAPVIKMGNPVVAVVNGEDISRSNVFDFIGSLPEQARQMPIQKLFPLALEQVVNNRLVGTKAAEGNLGDDPEVEKLILQAKSQIIRNVFVERQIKEQMTQKRVLKAYEELLDGLKPVQETKARHILVEDEATARELIAKLDAGADFEALAKEYSTGPSAENGGDLGWFAQNEMVAEFSKKAFALEPDTYTKDPVKTQFGWHVIKVDGRRTRPEPEFETVKPQLEAQLRQKVLTDLVTGWQKEAEIKKFDINGDEVKKN